MLRATTHVLSLRETFQIARGAADEETVVAVELERDGVIARGEGAPVDYWGESAQGMRDALEADGAALLGGDLFELERVSNRIAAWAIGARNTLRALLMALLEPIERLRELEAGGDYTTRLALLEELKGLPFSAVWDMYCLRQGAPVGMRFVDEIKTYERDVLAQRA